MSGKRFSDLKPRGWNLAGDLGDLNLGMLSMMMRQMLVMMRTLVILMTIMITMMMMMMTNLASAASLKEMVFSSAEKFSAESSLKTWQAADLPHKQFCGVGDMLGH